METRRITTLQYKGSKYEILKRKDGLYIAINHKEIDEEGKLKRTLNGFEMHARNTVEEVIDSVKMSLDITEIQEQTGVDRLEASKQWLLQRMAKEA